MDCCQFGPPAAQEMEAKQKMIIKMSTVTHCVFVCTPNTPAAMTTHFSVERCLGFGSTSC